MERHALANFSLCEKENGLSEWMSHARRGPVKASDAPLTNADVAINRAAVANLLIVLRFSPRLFMVLDTQFASAEVTFRSLCNVFTGN
jgi:hypothetical protein